jgi:hypothetical protein
MMLAVTLGLSLGHDLGLVTVAVVAAGLGGLIETF